MTRLHRFAHYLRPALTTQTALGYSLLMMIQTFELRNGVKVLAKEDGYSVTYSNRTQAERKAAELRAAGVDAFAYKNPMSRPFYVAIVEAK